MSSEGSRAPPSAANASGRHETQQYPPPHPQNDPQQQHNRHHSSSKQHQQQQGQRNQSRSITGGGGTGQQHQISDEITEQLLESLGDRNVEKRRTASHKIQHIVGELIRRGKFEQLRNVLEGITAQYASADDPHYRRGGAIAVAAAVAGMDVQTATQHLDIISEAVITRFSDQDDSVRKDAVESMFNIIKFVGHRILPIFPIVFTALVKLFADRSDPVVNAAQQLNERLLSTFATTEYDKESFLKIFVASIKENMHTQHPRIQTLILGWIREMDKVKDIDLVEYLPDFADRIFAMLESSNQSVCTQAMETLSDFRKYVANLNVDQLQEKVSLSSLVDLLVGQSSSSCNLTRLTAVEWMLTLIQLAGPNSLPWSATILDFIFQLLSDPSDEVVRKAHECNGLLLELTSVHVPSQSYENPVKEHDAEFNSDFRAVEKENVVEEDDGKVSNPAEQFTFPAVLTVVNLALPSPDTYTRTEALNWFTVLLQKAPGRVMAYFNELLTSLLHNLGDNADPNVLKSNIEVLARCAYYDWDYFHTYVLERIVIMFARSRALLENRGAFIIRRLCKQLVPEHIFVGISRILKDEEHPEFASIMVELLNLILLTASELGEVRDTLRSSFKTDSNGKQGKNSENGLVDIENLQRELHDRRATGIEVFEALFVTWCHNSIATFTLCLLAEAYELASTLITRMYVPSKVFLAILPNLRICILWKMQHC
eukprot:gb/GECG01011403.1/.p1 GENE.gb/GECG01011403.1/~~gb/GECG01011403.1/.p1  ORF type:complete len:714 (+),score=100.82 gb/GECG01011403.1/:1-2142(+)